jgi:hypothetical protein
MQVYDYDFVACARCLEWETNQNNSSKETNLSHELLSSMANLQ